MSISMIEFLRGKSFNKLKPYPHDPAQIRTVIVRRINLRIDNKRLRIYFSKGRRINLDDSTETLQTILTKLYTNRFKFNDKSPKMTDPYESELSLYNDALSFIVYQLSDKNFQFGSKGWPLTITDKGYAKDAYFAAHRVFYRHGQLIMDSGDGGDPVWDGCKVAFFIADHGKANIEFTGQYSDSINFHLEFYYKDDDDDERRYIPVIVDPDVRYPGGSTEP